MRRHTVPPSVLALRRLALTPGRVATALAIGLAVSAQPARPQEPEDPLVRRGTIRLEFSPEVRSWSRRFGTRLDGGREIEEVEPLGFDVTRDVVGVGMIPTLAGFEDAIARALGTSTFQLDLGESNLAWTHSVTRLPIRLDVGLTDWLTVSGTLPLVRSQPELDATFLADTLGANAGINPAVDDPESVSGFLSDLLTDLRALGVTTGAICDSQGAGSPECVSAMALLSEGREIEASLSGLYGNPEAFVPLSGTAAGAALGQRVDAFRTGMEGLGQSPALGAPPLSSRPLDGAGFRQLVTDPTYGVAFEPLVPILGQWGLGDVEMSVAVRLLERAPDSQEGGPGIRYRLGAEALVRLGTGNQPDPNLLQDLGTGDGQTDLEVRGFGSLLLGRRWGLWGHARLGFQGEARAVRRVALPDVALSATSSTAIVDWSPGRTFDLYLAPRYRFTEGLSLLVPYQGFRKAADRYTLQDGGLGPPPGAPQGTPPVTALDAETSTTAHTLGIGAVYSNLAAFRRGDSSLPVELRAQYRTTVAGSGGRTPKGGRFSATFRLFLSFWGDGA